MTPVELVRHVLLEHHQQQDMSDQLRVQIVPQTNVTCFLEGPWYMFLATMATEAVAPRRHWKTFVRSAPRDGASTAPVTAGANAKNATGNTPVVSGASNATGNKTVTAGANATNATGNKTVTAGASNAKNATGNKTAPVTAGASNANATGNKTSAPVTAGAKNATANTGNKAASVPAILTKPKAAVIQAQWHWKRDSE